MNTSDLIQSAPSRASLRQHLRAAVESAPSGLESRKFMGCSTHYGKGQANWDGLMPKLSTEISATAPPRPMVARASKNW